jgi:hypothetical protein
MNDFSYAVNSYKSDAGLCNEESIGTLAVSHIYRENLQKDDLKYQPLLLKII